MSDQTSGTIVVTGASGGLGSRIVGGLLDLGLTKIACHYRRAPGPVAGILQGHGLDPAQHLFQADLTDERAVKDMAVAVEARMGPVWGVVNVAGATSNGMSWKLTLEEFNRILSANLTPTFLVTREFLPGMRERGGGRIINVSSIVAHSGVAGASHYCAAKAAIEGFTRAVALEVAPKNVTVNCLALGYFDQGIIQDVPKPILEGIVSRVPLKRLGEAAEIAPLVAYLLGAQSRFMTGQVVHFNGGLYV